VSRGPATFRQQDVTRLLKAARAAGMEAARVEIDPTTGKIALVMIENGTPNSAEPSVRAQQIVL
jgi:hypothetical protein